MFEVPGSPEESQPTPTPTSFLDQIHANMLEALSSSIISPEGIAALTDLITHKGLADADAILQALTPIRGASDESH